MKFNAHVIKVYALKSRHHILLLAQQVRHGIRAAACYHAPNSQIPHPFLSHNQGFQCSIYCTRYT